jgi:glycosyltransferase involved in cell wall biosynthesis
MIRWHLITPEYPPQRGGVGDYTHCLAHAFAEAGDEVHVWCPPSPGRPPSGSGVQVYDDAGNFDRRGLRRLNSALDRCLSPRRLFIQWVPHGYSRRAMNIQFCLWVWSRARRGDEIDLMIHEAFLDFRLNAWRQDAVAVVQRVMLIILLRAASRVWISIPKWEQVVTPYALGRRIPLRWLPVISNIPVSNSPAAVDALRRRYAPDERLIVGHFGTFGAHIRPLLTAILPELLKREPKVILLLTGQHSKNFGDELVQLHPELSGAIVTTGRLEAESLSYHLSACDLMLQPYPDGISSRRGTAMAVLAHGRPMVTTLGHLSGDFWRESGAICAVPNTDTEAFLSAAQALIGNAESRQKLGRAAGAFYHERFDLQKVVATLSSRKRASIDAVLRP